MASFRGLTFDSKHLKEEVDHRASWTYLWADRANHERVLTLLEVDSSPIGYGSAHNVWHGIGVVCGFEFQPGALGILLQQSLAPASYVPCAKTSLVA